VNRGYNENLSVDEKNFWNGWIDDQIARAGLTAFDATVNRSPLDREISEDFKSDLWNQSRSSVKLLDVGAGPISVAGAIDPSAKLTISRICADPLGDYYTELLRNRGLSAPKYISRDAEELHLALPKGSVDYVFSRNALDHAWDAPYAIRAIFDHVLRPGGLMRLRHYECEAVFANYAGFHRWNFLTSGRQVLLFSQTQTHQLSSLLPDAGLRPCGVPSGQKLSGDQRPYCEVLLVKDSWANGRVAFEDRGLRATVSEEGRCIAIDRLPGQFDESLPTFVHFHFGDHMDSQNIVWSSSSDRRTYLLFDNMRRRASRIAVGQYVFTETSDHYSPKYQNIWYQAFRI
jgi:hypothetical protein